MRNHNVGVVSSNPYTVYNEILSIGVVGNGKLPHEALFPRKISDPLLVSAKLRIEKFPLVMKGSFLFQLRDSEEQLL